MYLTAGKKEGSYSGDDVLVLQCAAGYRASSGAAAAAAVCTDQGWHSDFTCCTQCPALKHQPSDVGYCEDETITMEHDQKQFQFTCMACSGTLEWHFKNCEDTNCPAYVPGEGVEVIDQMRDHVQMAPGSVELTSGVQVYTEGVRCSWLVARPGTDPPEQTLLPATYPACGALTSPAARLALLCTVRTTSRLTRSHIGASARENQ